MQIVIVAIVVILLAYTLRRMMKYKTEKGLRFLTLFSFSPIFIQPPLIRIANKAMRFFSRKEINITINNTKCAYYQKDENRPLLIYIHGGGFFFTAPPMAYKEAKRYSDELNLNVVFPDYRTDAYPAAFDDVKEVLLHFSKEYKRILIAGDSAGAALAAALTSFALKNNIKIEKLLLIYPVTDCTSSTPSMLKYTSSPLWNSRLNRKMWDLYLKNGKGEYAVPIELDNLNTFPPTLIEVEEYDSLHDEGVNLYRKIPNAILLDNKRTFHGYDYFIASKTVKESKKKRKEFLKVE